MILIGRQSADEDQSGETITTHGKFLSLTGLSHSDLFCQMNNDLLPLIDKYLEGKATENERELVDAWYLSFESNPGLTEQLSPEEVAKMMALNFAVLSAKFNTFESDFGQGSV
jgi:hypothetical protein